MSEAPGTPAAPTMLLRLSVPASSGFRSFAPDLAIKIAEYLGVKPPDAKSAGATIESLLAEIDPRDEKAEITFEFHRRHGELRIEAQCAGRSSEARHPLPI